MKTATFYKYVFEKLMKTLIFIALSGPIDPFYVKFPFSILIA